jgi:hypothetical protein
VSEHFCANLVLQTVEHEAQDPKTSIANCKNAEDQDQQDDPESIFIWTLFENCFETADSQLEDTLKNT